MSAPVNKAKKLIEELRRKGLYLAVAESCTGGWIGKTLTDVPGSSDVFYGGFIVYSNRLKTELLNIKENIIKEFGAVSGETAEAMAEGCLSGSGADISLAVTGIAGPGGGTADKPVGTVFVCVGCKNGSEILKKFIFSGGRRKIRKKTVINSLIMVEELISAEYT